MGVKTKGRRKITVDGKFYVWYVEQDDESEYYILNIVSEDKALIISCPLKAPTNYIISKGNIFQNRKTDGTWNRFLLPFDVPDIITPKFVSKVILWAVRENNAVRIYWNGKNAPV